MPVKRGDVYLVDAADQTHNPTQRDHFHVVITDPVYHKARKESLVLWVPLGSVKAGLHVDYTFNVAGYNDYMDPANETSVRFDLTELVSVTTVERQSPKGDLVPLLCEIGEALLRSRKTPEGMKKLYGVLTAPRLQAAGN